MKITSACLVALASAKKPRSWGDEENADACIYDEVDGVTTVTTVEELGAITKCYKKFSCDGGRNVMRKVNKMGLGSFQVGDQFCADNFIKFEYRVPREDNLDLAIEDKYCNTQSSNLELGEWKTMDDDVWFSFEFTEWDYYDWFYGYQDYQGVDVDSNVKFEIEIKCSEPVEPEPVTTTAPPPIETLPTTVPITTTAPFGNQADFRLEGARNSWEEMISKSTMKDKAKERTRRRFNKLCDKLQARHESLTDAGCSWPMINTPIFNAQFVDYDNTCETSSKIIQGIYLLIYLNHIMFVSLKYNFRFEKLGWRLY